MTEPMIKIIKPKWIALFLLWSMVYGLWTIPAEANIILKTLVVNPSQTKVQSTMLKAYLPEEVKPEDIAELGDLKIDYDVDRALYYVYKEFELQPGESVVRSVEIRDVWLISLAEVEAATNRTEELVDGLKKTAYFDTALSLQKDIESKAEEILAKQGEAMNALPQTHIAAYRKNKELLSEIKSLIAQLEKMLIEVRVASGSPARKVSVKATWWVILAVIFSLGLLSVVFFVIWNRQAGISVAKDKAEKAEREIESEEPPPPPEE